MVTKDTAWRCALALALSVTGCSNGGGGVSTSPRPPAVTVEDAKEQARKTLQDALDEVDKDGTLSAAEKGERKQLVKATIESRMAAMEDRTPETDGKARNPPE